MVKYAAAMQSRTADPEAILLRFSRAEVMHPTYKALSELGRAVKTIFLCRALLQTWGTAARRHPVGGLGSIGEMLIEHNHGFGQGRGSNSECSFNQAHLPHDTWLQAPCLGLSFA